PRPPSFPTRRSSDLSRVGYLYPQKKLSRSSLKARALQKEASQDMDGRNGDQAEQHSDQSRVRLCKSKHRQQYHDAVKSETEEHVNAPGKQTVVERCKILRPGALIGQ